MPCEINNLSPIRNLYIECQESILNTYNISSDNRKIISSISYLVLPTDSRNYTRIAEGEKSKYKDSYRKPFITPRNLRVGFNVLIDNNNLNIRRCLEFLATSSISTSNGNVYVPVTILDYVRPEYSDPIFTTRKGLLTLGEGTGYSGSSSSEAPLYTEEYDINFMEIFKRLVM